jgi:asparagine synthetase B (glutamine-hydrolysing)
MSGWFVRYRFNSTPADGDRWAESIRLAARAGDAVEQQTQLAGGAIALATWRRNSGEFPCSGLIHQFPGELKIGWVGQCLEDDGDASQQAMQVLANNIGRNSPRTEQFAQLNGPFSAAVIQKSPTRLMIVVDRHRHLPVYVHKSAKYLVATTDLCVLKPWLDNPRISASAVDLLLRCGELIDDMTLLDGVRILPSATVLTVANGDVSESQHWSLRHDPHSKLGFQKLADDLGERLRNAVLRVERANNRVGITLSGGLDSRFLLGLCSQPQQVPSFTWGLPNCRDITCAADFARRVNSLHQVRNWVPADFPPQWERGVDATGGAIGVDSMYLLPYTQLLERHCDVILNGLAGDAILGGNFLRFSWLRERDLAQLAQQSWHWRVSAAEDEQVDRLMPVRIAKRGRDLWVDSILRETREQPILRLNDWLYPNRVSRNTNCGNMLQRRRVESHAPFFDRDFLDLVLQVPLEMRLKHRLYLQTMNRACPAAGRSPWQRTNIPPGWGFHANLASMAFHRVWTELMKSVGRQAFPKLAVATPAKWMRTEWRQSVENIILSETLLSRGIVSPDGVREIWRRHLAGEEYTRTIGALISVELFARMMADTSGVDIGNQANTVMS